MAEKTSNNTLYAQQYAEIDRLAKEYLTRDGFHNFKRLLTDKSIRIPTGGVMYTMAYKDFMAIAE